MAAAGGGVGGQVAEGWPRIATREGRMLCRSPGPQSLLEGASLAGWRVALRAGLVLDMRGLVQVLEVGAGGQKSAAEEAPLRAEEKPGGSSARPPLEVLEALQWQLSAESARGRRDYLAVKLATAQRRKPILERRRSVIQRIPGFWAKAISFPVLCVVVVGMVEEDGCGERARRRVRACEGVVRGGQSLAPAEA